jgi:hypothetical protein
MQKGNTYEARQNMIGLICNVNYGRSVMTILIIALIILIFGALIIRY